MNKQQNKPPADPIASACAMVHKFDDAIANPDGKLRWHDDARQMLHTVLIVRAIDRLAGAVRDNTEALKGIDGTLDNGLLPEGHPHRR